MLDSDAREVVRYMAECNRPDSSDLVSRLVTKQFDLLKTEKDSMGSRAVERFSFCSEYEEIISKQQVNSLLLEGLEATSDVAFNWWCEEIQQSADKPSSAFARQVCDKILQLIDSAYQSRAERQVKLWEIFATLIPLLPAPQDSELW